jgi:tetraacyldisaccharide 4'-kinase
MVSLRSRLPALWADPSAPSPLRPFLRPMSVLYGLGAHAVDRLWHSGWRSSVRAPLPTISVGNLSVGGTGKTPVTSWIAEWMVERGVRPAIVLRGYGDDEPEVHRRLLPAAIVVADADRARGIAQAHTHGAQVAILDDGFQHRRVARDLDLVLLSIEQIVSEIDGRGRWCPQLLPAGPYREPIAALKRASLLLLTRKRATVDDVSRARAAVRNDVGGIGQVVVALVPDQVVLPERRADASASLAGRRVLAIAGIGAPSLFAAQLTRLGATVTLRAYADHHAFDGADARELAALARQFDMAICTLKDHVKLAPLWPASAPPLSYLSQRCTLEDGADQLLDALTGFATRRS